MSLVEALISNEDGQTFLSVPLAANLFGKRKLITSSLRAAVEADVHVLQSLGAARKEDVRHGVLPRVRRLLRTVSGEVSRGREHPPESAADPRVHRIQSAGGVVGIGKTLQ